MRLRFCVLSVLGDVLDDGELHFVETAKTLKGARRRIETLAAAWPGEYVIYDEQTGGRIFITAGPNGGKGTIQAKLFDQTTQATG